MPGPPVSDETQQLEALAQAIDDLRRRVAALEQGEFAPASPVPHLAVATPVEETPLAGLSSGHLAALGRLLLGIAGAYLLRAISEAGILPPLAGTLLGIAYAAGWLLSSLRIPATARLSAAVQSIAAVCIVAPLLWEATVRFHTLPAWGAAVSLAVFITLGQVVGWQRDHSAIAGITSFAGCLTAVALIAATLHPVPFAAALVATAAVVEYGALRDRALGFRWIIALAVDSCTLLLVYLVTRPQGLPEGYAPISNLVLVALLLIPAAIYLLSLAVRSLVRGLTITWFELVQVAAVVVLAISGALEITHAARVVVIIAGISCLTLGAACYLAAIAGPARASARNFHVYTTFGLLLMSSGNIFLFSGLPLAAAMSAFALAALALGWRRQSNIFTMHGALYLLGGAANSGLLVYAALALTRLDVRVDSVTPGAVVCAVGAAFGYGLASRKPTSEHWAGSIASLLLAGLLCWSAVGLAAAFLARLGLQGATLSTLHTALISVIALLLAWFGPRRNRRELVWLLYPWMLFGAGKLVAIDFQQGHAATLFVSLLVYGGTLMALPRLLRQVRG